MDYDPHVNPYSPHAGPTLGFALSYRCGHNYFLYTSFIQQCDCFKALVCIDLYVLYCLPNIAFMCIFQVVVIFLFFTFFLCFVVDLCPGLFVLQMRAGVQLTWQEGLR